MSANAKQVQITVTLTYPITEKDAANYYDVDTSQDGWAQRAVDVDAQAFEGKADAAEFIASTAGLVMDVISAEVLP